MSEMGKVVVRRVGGIDVVCRELTVGQVRGIMQTDVEGDLVTDCLFSEVRLHDLELLCGLTREQIDALRPSELRVVVEACKEANPDFFAMLARVAEARKLSLASSTSASAR